MSVDYAAVAAYGWRLTEIAEVRAFATRVTRYDEKTGKPYEKAVATYQLVVLDRPVAVFDRPHDPEEWPCLLAIADPVSGRVPVVDVHGCNDGRDTNDCVFGVALADVSGEGGVRAEITFEQLANAADTCRGLLARLAAAVGADPADVAALPPPRLWVGCTVSI